MYILYIYTRVNIYICNIHINGIQYVHTILYTFISQVSNLFWFSARVEARPPDLTHLWQVFFAETEIWSGPEKGGRGNQQPKPGIRISPAEMGLQASKKLIKPFVLSLLRQFSNALLTPIDWWWGLGLILIICLVHGKCTAIHKLGMWPSTVL